VLLATYRFEILFSPITSVITPFYFYSENDVADRLENRAQSSLNALLSHQSL
jgi:hypothetical protein